MSDNMNQVASDETIECPKGIGGWLIIVIIGHFMTLQSILSRLNQIASTQQIINILFSNGSTTYNSKTVLWYRFIVFSHMFLLVLIIAVIILFFSKSKYYPKVALVQYFLFIIIYFFLFVFTWKLWTGSKAELMGRATTIAIINVFPKMIWMYYIASSKRVKNTFV